MISNVSVRVKVTVDDWFCPAGLPPKRADFMRKSTFARPSSTRNFRAFCKRVNWHPAPKRFVSTHLKGHTNVTGFTAAGSFPRPTCFNNKEFLAYHHRRSVLIIALVFPLHTLNHDSFSRHHRLRRRGNHLHLCLCSICHFTSSPTTSHGCSGYHK